MDLKMFFCYMCNHWFTSVGSFLQHVTSSPNHWSYICYPCRRTFVTQRALVTHWIHNSLHAYCRHCDQHFLGLEELQNHYEVLHSMCRICEQTFDSIEILKQHYLDDHHYCDGCKRCFNNAQSLDMHLRTSAIHNIRAYKCPGRRCGKSFVSYGDMALHCESGACRSGITRKAVNKLAIEQDSTNVITNPARLIAGPPVSEVVGVWATPTSWNGQAYECVLCHRTFRTLPALNAHLQSPVHDTKIYRCPTAYCGCNVEFKTLSALVHHVERSECGVTKFRAQVTNALDEITRGMRKIGL